MITNLYRFNRAYQNYCTSENIEIKVEDCLMLWEEYQEGQHHWLDNYQ